jgi:spermidine synthase
MNALGRHILVEFVGCCSDVLNDVDVIEKGMVDAAKNAGATVINSTFHHFSPYGVSGVVVIQESHLAIHTWPEYQYAAVDLFTCGDTVDPWISFDHLQRVFQAKNHSALEMHRGSINMLNRVEFKAKDLRKQMEEELQPQYKRNLWFTDKDENQALSLRYSGNVLFKETSPYQTVSVYDTHAYGKMLAIDNMIMCTERDEFHYHEMIVHPALQAHGKAENVLVIGGGDGGTIREILRYPNVKNVTMVEIDDVVIRASKEWLPQISKEFNNPRLNLIVGDGIEFVKKAAPETYDVIIIDGSDPVGPAEGFFTVDFYRHAEKALKHGGILTAQGESPMFHTKAFVALHQCFREVFGPKNAFASLFYVPSYPSGMWSIQMATKGNFSPAVDFDSNKAKDFASANGLRYYNAEIHRAAFALPTFVQNLLNG